MRLQVFTFWEWCVSLKEVPEIGTAALDQMSGQTPALVDFIGSGEVLGQILEYRVEEREQGAEGALVPAVRRSCNKNKMAVYIFQKF